MLQVRQLCGRPASWLAACSVVRPSARAARFAPGVAEFSTDGKEPETELCRALKSRMMLKGGPMSVADYIQEVLTHPVHGFYMQHDVFGRKGDFITSPEISQMFGEMLGIWSVANWMQQGCPKQVRLVELGPGRGTLMTDLLRGVAAFPDFVSALDIHLVEVSPALRQLQWKALRCSADPASTSTSFPPTSSRPDSSTQSSTSSSTTGSPTGGGTGSTTSNTAGGPIGSMSSSSSNATGSTTSSAASSTSSSAEGTTKSSTGGGTDDNAASSTHSRTHSRDRGAGAGKGKENAEGTLQAGLCGITGVPVRWHQSLDSVPSDLPTIFILHEFIDALPVHQFVRDPKRGWLEKMVTDAEDDKETPYHLRFVLSPRPTPASTLLMKERLKGLPEEVKEKMDAIEIGVHGMAIVERLALRIAQHGGAALIVDYGKDGPYSDSLMAIRHHKGLKVLEQPGLADLSTWVDFSALRQAAERVGPAVKVHGPVSQKELLLSCGIEARLNALKLVASGTQAADLESQFHRLTDMGPEGMGSTYQAMAIVPASVEAPLGFLPTN